MTTIGYALGAEIALETLGEHDYPLTHAGAVIAHARRAERGLWTATMVDHDSPLAIGSSLREVAEIAAVSAYLARAIS